MSTAEEIYTNVNNYLLSEDKLKAYEEICDPSNGLEEIFDKFWSIPSLRNILALPEPRLDISSKGNEISEKLRVEGNRLYKEKKFDKALLAYNYAVISAPHPEVPKSSRPLLRFTDQKKQETQRGVGICPSVSLATDASGRFDCLSFAYANRSALLFEMGNYEQSMADIDRAVAYGYPKDKSRKLEERKGKCLLHLGECEKAEQKFKEILQLLKKDEKEKNSQSIPMLEKLLQNCRINSKSSLPNPVVETKEAFKNTFFRGPESLVFPSSKTIDVEKGDLCFLDDGIKVQYSAAKGRHLVAARDIEPGEVIIAERASCSTLKLNQNLRLYCCVCMRRSPVPLPCFTCSLVVFCSERCRHNDRVHHVECPVLSTVITLRLDEEVSLVFRTFCSFTMHEIRTQLKRKDCCKDHESFSREKLQPKRAFQNLCQLVANIPVRSSECLKETAVNSTLLVQALMKVPLFWNGDKEFEAENIKILGGLAMRWILSFQCNIHCLKELLIDKERNLISAKTNEIGYGIYNAFSLMNHSCVPNALHSSWGDVKFLFATSPIRKGEDVVDSYGERYASHDLKTRQDNLLETYHFKCDCKACSENWPPFDGLPSKFTLICPNCHQVLNLACQKCDFCQANDAKKKNKKNSKLLDVDEVQSKLKSAWFDYDCAYKALNRYETSFENIKKISKFISLLDRYTLIPHKPYLEAQETLLRSFDLLGSHVFIDI